MCMPDRYDGPMDNTTSRSQSPLTSEERWHWNFWCGLAVLGGLLGLNFLLVAAADYMSETVRNVLQAVLTTGLIVVLHVWNLALWRSRHW